MSQRMWITLPTEIEFPDGMVDEDEVSDITYPHRLPVAFLGKT